MTPFSDTPEVTEFLLRLRAGESVDDEGLAVILFQQLRQQARQASRPGAKPAMGSVELVNAAYERLFRVRPDRPASEWNDRHHFLAVATKTMRHLLVDLWKRERRAPLPLELEPQSFQISPEDAASLKDAYGRLADTDPDAAQVVDLTVFGGLKIAEIAEITGRSNAWVHGRLHSGRQRLWCWVSGRSDLPLSRRTRTSSR